MPGETLDGDVLPPESEDRPGAGAERPAEPSPALMALLQAIGSGSTDPQKLMLDLIGSQAASERPEAGMLMKLLATGDEGAKTEALREELRAEIREEEAERVAELGDAAERLLAESRSLHARIEALAAAIGACPVCFGDDLLCPTCSGAGRPGSRLPEAEGFHLYVRPAVERVRAALSRAAPRRPWPRNPAAGPAAVTTPARAGARP